MRDKTWKQFVLTIKNILTGHYFFLPENTTHTISVESLNNALLKNGSEYVSTEARQVDEKIFFFVPDEYIERDEKFLCDFILRNTL